MEADGPDPPRQHPRPFVLDYRRPEPAGRWDYRAPFGPISSFFVGNLVTGAAAALAAVAFLPRTPAMEDAVPCMVCGTFATGAPVA